MSEAVTQLRERERKRIQGFEEEKTRERDTEAKSKKNWGILSAERFIPSPSTCVSQGNHDFCNAHSHCAACLQVVNQPAVLTPNEVVDTARARGRRRAVITFRQLKFERTIKTSFGNNLLNNEFNLGRCELRRSCRMFCCFVMCV